MPHASVYFDKIKGLGIQTHLIPPKLSEAEYQAIYARIKGLMFNTHLAITDLWQLAALSGAVKNIDLKAGARDNCGANFAHYAAWSGNKEALEWVKKNYPALLTRNDSYGSTIAHYAALSGSCELFNLAQSLSGCPAYYRVCDYNSALVTNTMLNILLKALPANDSLNRLEFNDGVIHKNNIAELSNSAQDNIYLLDIFYPKALLTESPAECAQINSLLTRNKILLDKYINPLSKAQGTKDYAAMLTLLLQIKNEYPDLDGLHSGQPKQLVHLYNSYLNILSEVVRTEPNPQLISQLLTHASVLKERSSTLPSDLAHYLFATDDLGPDTDAARYRFIINLLSTRLNEEGEQQIIRACINGIRNTKDKVFGPHSANEFINYTQLIAAATSVQRQYQNKDKSIKKDCEQRYGLLAALIRNDNYDSLAAGYLLAIPEIRTILKLKTEDLSPHIIDADLLSTEQLPLTQPKVIFPGNELSSAELNECGAAILARRYAANNPILSPCGPKSSAEVWNNDVATLVLSKYKQERAKSGAPDYFHFFGRCSRVFGAWSKQEKIDAVAALMTAIATPGTKIDVKHLGPLTQGRLDALIKNLKLPLDEYFAKPGPSLNA